MSNTIHRETCWARFWRQQNGSYQDCAHGTVFLTLRGREIALTRWEAQQVRDDLNAVLEAIDNQPHRASV